ncbi:MAG: hypothetical protein FWE35_10505 [Streptosporangiales bacterium]|nr:hypothetical protein [Streptosporangiales bacterium]
MAAGNAAGNVASRPAGGSAVFKSGPLGVLPVPSGARPWHRDVAAPMPAKAFVQGFYEKSAQSHEEGRFARRRYQSGIIRGWDTASGAVQDVNIMRFATVNGAASEFDELTSALDDQLGKGGKDVTDSADGARGTANPMRDAHGYAEVELAARVGRDEVVDVHERTLSKPDPGAAKALLLKQVNALKGRH